MAHTHKPQNRPSRLPASLQWIVGVSLTLSFLSGCCVWWGRHLQEVNGKSPSWLHLVFVLHGFLYPVICILYGFLLRHHTVVSWEIKANLVSGSLMVFVLGGLILSGVGIHYVGSERILDSITKLHKIFGLALPAAMLSHWFLALAWAKKVQLMPK